VTAGRKESGEYASADQSEGAVLGGDDPDGLDDPVTGGLESDGETAAVGVGARDGLGGLDPHGP
jgi:hypothetical protein